MAPAKPVPQPGEQVRPYETRYYTIYTDLDLDAVREAAARVTAMAEEYYSRTKGFAGVITRRLPFYLFGKAEDYHAAGGRPGTAGVYNGKRLMALASRGASQVWHTVQHEGFHQFAHMVITPRLPVWVNEGLAEYFAEGIWTGDNFVTGVIPPSRLKRIQALVKENKLAPFLEMLTMSHADWKTGLSIRNYDQAWSMVHFLAHADDGKYQAAFSAFINDVARGRPYEQAFSARVGGNVDAFQARYGQWWGQLDANPTAELYIQAVVSTLTSFLARAAQERQKFSDAQEFLQAAGDGSLKCPAELWLPPSLLESAAKQAGKLKEWSIETGRDGRLKLLLKLPDGTVLAGTFSPRVRQGPAVTVTIEKPKPATAGPAKPPTRPAAGPATPAKAPTSGPSAPAAGPAKAPAADPAKAPDAGPATPARAPTPASSAPAAGPAKAPAAGPATPAKAPTSGPSAPAAGPAKAPAAAATAPAPAPTAPAATTTAPSE